MTITASCTAFSIERAHICDKPTPYGQSHSPKVVQALQNHTGGTYMIFLISNLAAPCDQRCNGYPKIHPRTLSIPPPPPSDTHCIQYGTITSCHSPVSFPLSYIRMVTPHIIHTLTTFAAYIIQPTEVQFVVTLWTQIKSHQFSTAE